jgi:NAD(P)-dependent dehydrogenase (short-subunit alcohol dehydrogenase family)
LATRTWLITKHQIATNLTGPIQLVRSSAAYLRKQGGGRILGLSTYGGQAALPGGSLYHASKWGLEGFLDAMSSELASFNIGVTIVEPGGARTNFRLGGAKLGVPMEAYQGTPAAMVHSMIKDTSRLPPGDPVKMVRIMIDSAEQNPAPKRIVLGSDAWGIIQKALSERLAAVEAQKDTATATDFAQKA